METRYVFQYNMIMPANECLARRYRVGHSQEDRARQEVYFLRSVSTYSLRHPNPHLALAGVPNWPSTLDTHLPLTWGSSVPSEAMETRIRSQTDSLPWPNTSTGIPLPHQKQLLSSLYTGCKKEREEREERSS